MTALEFNHHVAQHAQALQLFTRKFTNDYEESQDLVQETILKALTYRDKFKTGTNLKGWLYTIMKNTFINKYRKAQRAKTTYDNTADLYYLNVEDTHTFRNPDSTSEYADMWKKIGEIRPEYHEPFKLHVEGFKYDEISSKLNIPIGTVKNRIFHARKEIQKKLGKNYK